MAQYAVNDLKMFPRSTPITTDDGHLLNEQNISKLVKLLLGKESCVIDNSSKTTLEIILQGYRITMPKPSEDIRYIIPVYDAANMLIQVITKKEADATTEEKAIALDLTSADNYQILNCGSSTEVI